jgi:putative transposase
MTEHLGYGRHDPAGRDGGNSRNGTRTKTVLTEIGPVEIEGLRDRDASFDSAWLTFRSVSRRSGDPISV